MLVYKYRGADNDEIFNRDIESIRRNYYWAPSSDDLNDPFETLIISDEYQTQLNILRNIFGKHSFKKDTSNVDNAIKNLLDKKNKVGIYSLSTIWNNELMWAHYSDSHRGFCIEYNLDILLDDNFNTSVPPFNVDYFNNPPRLSVTDFLSNSNFFFLKKLLGTKSKSWSYEKEYRVITDKIGKHYYYFRAVKSIYFGHRMHEKHKEKVMRLLAGRGIKYFQVQLKKGAYSFTKVEIEDRFHSEKPYLFEIWRKQENNQIKKITYDILKRENFRTKGQLLVELSEKISQKELEEVSVELRSKLYENYQTVFISYHLKGEDQKNGYWAIAHFTGEKSVVKINGVTMELEEKFLYQKNHESRNVIGIWLDKSHWSPSILTLFKQNEKYYLEIKYKDDSLSTTEFTLKTENEFIKIGKNLLLGKSILIDKLGNLKSINNTGQVFNTYSRF